MANDNGNAPWWMIVLIVAICIGIGLYFVIERWPVH